MTKTRKKRKRLIGGVKVTVGDNVIKSTTTTVCRVKILQKDVDDVREKLKSLGIDKEFFNNPTIQKLLEQNCDNVNENRRVDSAANDWLMSYDGDIIKVMKRIHNDTLDATEIFKLLTKNKNNVEQTISMIDTATSSLPEAPAPPPAPSSLTEAPAPPPAPSSLTETLGPSPAPSSLTETPGPPPSSLPPPAPSSLTETPQEEGNPYFNKYEFEVAEFYNITKGQYTLKDAIELLKNPVGIRDLVTRKKVEIIRMVESERDSINQFDKDTANFDANGDERVSGTWNVILKLNAFLFGIKKVNEEEASAINRIYDNNPTDALKHLPDDNWLVKTYSTSLKQPYELLKQKLEYAFFLNPSIKNMKFKNIDELVVNINITIQESKGIRGGKRTRRRKLFRHKTRNAVNRL